MCGRILLTSPVAAINSIFGTAGLLNLPPRFNLAPTQQIPVVRREEEGRRLVPMRWGLVPSWADDPAIGSRLINARGESVADKPSFRDAFRKRRCLVPIDGFYEWRAEGQGKRSRKQGYVIRRRDRSPFALAGLWECWNGPKGGPVPERPLETVTVVTTASNGTLSFLHDRMPVVLDPADWDLWLDPAAPRPALEALLKPAPDTLLDAVAVGPAVNNVRNDDPSCLAPPEGDRDAAPRLL